MNQPHPPARPETSRRWFHRREPLPPDVAQHQTTAFVYGNIVVLATLFPLNLHEITRGDVASVLGIAFSTFLMHVFANVVATTWSWDRLRREARASLPILTSGLVPALVVSTALVGAPSLLAVLIAELLLVTRLGLLGVLVARLQDRPLSLGATGAGVGVAVVALVLVLAKALLPH